MPKYHPKVNAPFPDKPFDAEGLELDEDVAVREGRKEGRPDDPTIDGLPVKNKQPFKKLTDGK